MGKLTADSLTHIRGIRGVHSCRLLSAGALLMEVRITLQLPRRAAPISSLQTISHQRLPDFDPRFQASLLCAVTFIFANFFKIAVGSSIQTQNLALPGRTGRSAVWPICDGNRALPAKRLLKGKLRLHRSGLVVISNGDISPILSRRCRCHACKHWPSPV